MIEVGGQDFLAPHLMSEICGYSPRKMARMRRIST